MVSDDARTDVNLLTSAAGKLNIVEEFSLKNALDVRLLAANRFLLEQIREDYRRVAGETRMLDQVSLSDECCNITC